MPTPPPFESLLRADDPADPRPAPGADRFTFLSLFRMPPARALREGWRWFTDHPEHRRRHRTIGAGLVLALVLGAGLGAWSLVPRSRPDYLDDALDDVLDYTLLSDEFNRLPVHERLKLIRDLVERLRSMEGGDSVMMASFAAGIAGAAREQLEENIARLSVDIADTYAIRLQERLAEVSTEQDRAAAIERTFLDMTREMEEIGGVRRDVSDEERLADARRDAQRGESQMRRMNQSPRAGERAAGLFTILDSRVGSRATPTQRSRITVMIRDMSRHFRKGG
ncbi:MAG: hypothetical protein FJ255_12310 [Phycisphaerae bacterium]|nr:hypothetical protein [Phycisphaerae bacterium]